jgi:hypothetical protein
MEVVELAEQAQNFRSGQVESPLLHWVSNKESVVLGDQDQSDPKSFLDGIIFGPRRKFGFPVDLSSKVEVQSGSATRTRA